MKSSSRSNCSGLNLYFHNTVFLAGIASVMLLAACATKQPQPTRKDKAADTQRAEEQPAIKYAPEWVNKGSIPEQTKNGRMFHGVGVAIPMGDLALQKAVADDMARDEVARIFMSYLETAALQYTASQNMVDGVAQNTGPVAEAVLDQLKRASRAMLTSTRIMGSWREAASNNIWSIAELDLKQVKAVIAGQAEMNEGLRNYLAVEAENLFDRKVMEGKPVVTESR